MNLYEVSGLTKIYGEGNARVVALNGISLTIPENRFVAVIGASGSGKSTLLNMLGCMDRPSAGSIKFLGKEMTSFSKKQMTAFRSTNIGFVFQSYNLLPDLTAIENVELSTELAGGTRQDASDALAVVGLAERRDHYPAELSGGEQQRVSIARAIAKKPGVLLCDEPTGALDFKTGILVLDALKKIHLERGTAVVLITHNQEIARMADLLITLQSGELQSVSENSTVLLPHELSW